MLYNKKSSLLFVILLTLTFISSCSGPVTISGVPLRLLANFEADTPNTRPNAELPGNPAGDQILYNGRGGIVNPDVYNDHDKKGLRIINTRGGVVRNEDRMVFRGTSVTYPTNVYYTWKASILAPFVAGSLTINLTDGAGHDNVSLRFLDYQTVEAGTSMFGYLYLMPAREFLGKVPIYQECSYSVSIDQRTNTFSMTVLRPSFPDGNLSITNHPLTENLSAGAKNPSIEIKNETAPPEFQYGTTLVNPTSGIILLDDLMIQAD